jgi:hypothetical protein
MLDDDPEYIKSLAQFLREGSKIEVPTAIRSLL